VGEGGGPTRNAASSSLACIHDPNPAHTGAAHPPIARTPWRCEAQFRRQRGKGPLPRFTRLLRYVSCTTSCTYTRTISDPRRRAALRRDGGTSVPDERASGRSVLGQGCLGPITIAHADTQQCAFLESDSPWLTCLFPCLRTRVRSLFLSLLLSWVPFAFSISLVPSVSRVGPSLGAPTSESRVRMPLPLPQKSQGALEPPPSAAILSSPVIPHSGAGRAFVGSFDPPRQATFSGGFDL